MDYTNPAVYSGLKVLCKNGVYPNHVFTWSEVERASRSSGPASGFLHFKGSVLRTARSDVGGRRLPQAVAHDAQRLWNEELSPGVRKEWALRANAAWAHKQRAKEEDEELQGIEKSRVDASLADCFWGLCSERWPMAPEVLEQAVRSSLGVPANDKLPGHRTYCDMLRTEWMRTMLVDDTGAIPPGLAVSERPPCWKRHPGLCRHADEDRWRECSSLAGALRTYFLSSSVAQGTFYKIAASFANEEETCAHVCFGHKRGARPKLCLIAFCKLDHSCEPPVVQFEKHDNDTLFVLTCSALAKKVLTSAEKRPAPALRRLALSPLLLQGGRDVPASTGDGESAVLVKDGCVAAVADHADDDEWHAAESAEHKGAVSADAFAHWKHVMEAGLQGLTATGPERKRSAARPAARPAAQTDLESAPKLKALAEFSDSGSLGWSDSDADDAAEASHLFSFDSNDCHVRASVFICFLGGRQGCCFPSL